MNTEAPNQKVSAIDPTPSIPLVPCGDRLLVLRDKPKEVTSAGIHIPGSDPKAPNFWTVLKIGPDCERFKVGQRLYFPDFAGVGIKLESNGLVTTLDNIRLVREEEVLATLE